MAKYVSALTGPEMDAALQDMAQHNSEAWAVGTRDGEAVSSADVTYHNNAAYYSETAMTAAARAEAAVPAGTEGAVLFSRAQSLTDAQKVQARSNISAGQGGTNPNLLDNPWFTVNQRGVTNGGFENRVYRFDRWYTSYGSNTNGTWSWGANGVTLTSPNNSESCLMQKIASPELLDGKKLTASLLLTDGTILRGTVSFNHATAQTFLIHNLVRVQWLTGAFAIIVLASQTIAIRAVKLEVGDISTIANDAPPNYAEELLKCQRYFLRVLRNGSYSVDVGFGVADSTTTARITIPTPVPMAKAPTVSMSGTVRIQSGGSGHEITNISNYQSVTNVGVQIHPTTSGLTNGDNVILSLGSNGAYIDLSADL